MNFIDDINLKETCLYVKASSMSGKNLIYIPRLPGKLIWREITEIDRLTQLLMHVSAKLQ